MSFQAHFTAQQVRLKKMEISTISREANSPKPRVPYVENPRPWPGLAEHLAEEAEDREIRAYVRSMTGGTRTIAPHPNAVRAVDRFTNVVEPMRNREMNPVVHVPARVPVVTDDPVLSEREKDRAEHVQMLEVHLVNMRKHIAEGELRLAKLRASPL